MSQYEIMKLIREGRTNGFIGPSENLKHYPDYIKNMDDVYKFSKMICTDDSDLQFGIEIEEGRWEYTQIANRRLYDLFTNYPQEFCKAYDEKLWINGINVRYECYLEYAVVSELIYLDKYSDEEIEDIIAPYGFPFECEPVLLLKDIEVPELNSPSALAIFCCGSSRNGTTSWEDANGNTYDKEWWLGKNKEVKIESTKVANE